MNCLHSFFLHATLYVALYVIIFIHTFVVSSVCFRTYTSPKGVIASPRFPGRYPRGVSCINMVRAPAGYRIHLHWLHFKVFGEMPECHDDFVRIARCTLPRKYLSRYCGTDFIPHDIYSYDNCIMVEFHSKKNSPRYKGFEIRYTRIDATMPIKCSQCPASSFDISSSNSALVRSPNWPLSYSGFVMDSCKWRMEVGKRRAKIFFMGIDLYNDDKNSSKNLPLCHQNSSDVIIVKGVSQSEVVYKYYCGTHKPFTIYYHEEFEFIEIIFKVRYHGDHDHRGFVLGIVSFVELKGGAVMSEVKQWWIVVIVGIFIFIVVFVHLRNQCKKHGGCSAILRRPSGRVEHVQSANRRIDAAENRHPVNPAASSNVSNIPTSPSLPSYPPPSYLELTQANQDQNGDQVSSGIALPPLPSYDEVVSHPDPSGHPNLGYTK